MNNVFPYPGIILRYYFNLPKELILIILQYSCNIILPKRNVIYMYVKFNTYRPFHVFSACKPHVLNDTRIENDIIHAQFSSHNGNVFVDYETPRWSNGTIQHKITDFFQSSHIQIQTPFNFITNSYIKYHKKYIKFPSNFITKKEIYQWIKGHKINASMRMKKADLLNAYFQGIKNMN